MKKILWVMALWAASCTCWAQRFHLFDEQIKEDLPSIAYDFLERYLYELDSLQRKGVDLTLRLQDDKFLFRKGNISTARKITPDTPFNITRFENKFYEVVWKDDNDKVIFDVAFPMQYELLWGKSKVEIEKELKQTLSALDTVLTPNEMADELGVADDGCKMSKPQVHYYVESVNNGTYYRSGDKTLPTFDAGDKWHSAANLFQGVVEKVGARKLYVDQNLYGFKKMQYMVNLAQWLNYCQNMQMTVYFAVEEEHEDGLKALLIAQNNDLAFNHMMSLIIPDDFVTNEHCVIKATLNAYIPTQNVKDLYQQYKKTPKKKI